MYHQMNHHDDAHSCIQRTLIASQAKDCGKESENNKKVVPMSSGVLITMMTHMHTEQGKSPRKSEKGTKAEPL